MFDNVDLSNGLDWTEDGKIFYFVDSIKNIVEAFDVDVETGDLSNRRVVFDPKKHDNVKGFCDGMAIDKRGNLWIAMYFGYSVRKSIAIFVKENLDKI